MSISIGFIDKTPNKAGSAYKNIIKKAAAAVLKEEEVTAPAELSVVLVDNEEIRKINRQFRNTDIPTDVLSFPASEFNEEFGINPDTNRIILGDIVISVEKALNQAEEYNHLPEREIAFLTVHGVLHLIGYDHEISKDEEEIMFKRQEEILKKAGFIR